MSPKVRAEAIINKILDLPWRRPWRKQANYWWYKKSKDYLVMYDEIYPLKWDFNLLKYSYRSSHSFGLADYKQILGHYSQPAPTIVDVEL